jgi:hypothetical protein
LSGESSQMDRVSAQHCVCNDRLWVLFVHSKKKVKSSSFNFNFWGGDSLFRKDIILSQYVKAQVCPKQCPPSSQSSVFDRTKNATHLQHQSISTPYRTLKRQHIKKNRSLSCRQACPIICLSVYAHFSSKKILFFRLLHVSQSDFNVV